MNRSLLTNCAAIHALLVLSLMSVPAQSMECAADAAYEGPEPRTGAEIVFPSARVDISEAMAEGRAAILDAAFESVLTNTDAPAAAMAVWSPVYGYWSRSSGLDEDAPGSFWWASVGKLVTGTLILELIEEEKLSLDERIDRWFPDYPQSALITVDDLLLHRSGVFSFQADEKLGKKRGYKSPAKLLQVSAGHGADFCPGSNWYYSNTGYLMLGLIVEALEQEPLSEVVARRIAEPLGLDSLQLVTKGDPDELIVPPHNDPPTRVREIASLHGAGGVIAEPGDMLVFLNAVLTGRLYSSTALKSAFADLYPMFGSGMHYGRGVMLIDVLDPDTPTTWLGHVGGSPDSKAVLIYDAERDTYAALVLNKAAPGEAVVNVLLKAMDGLP
ncbi:MAG: serine hydrolase domain-containing protein [Pseudomonadota bacterium]